MRKSTWLAMGASLAGACLLASPTPSAAQGGGSVVGGTPTSSDWPAVGSLVTGGGTCTVTLVGCRSVLTAAHCICDPAGTGAACPDGTSLLDPNDYLVFLQQAGDQDPLFSPSFGQFAVESVAVAPSYEFGNSSDLALLKLAFPVRGIRPDRLNTLASPANGTSVTIVGFGTTAETSADSGIKREGGATTGSCAAANVPDATHVCWSSLPSTTCLGDSGGPLFADVGAGTTVAGVHSGGADLCIQGDVAFDADVFVDTTWLQSAGGADLTVSACGDGPQVGDAQVTSTTFNGQLSGSASHSFPVAAGTKLLRVALNAELGTAPNDFDLLLRFGSPPTHGSNDCYPALLGSFEYCEIPDPAPGTWHVLVETISGGPGEYQVVATRFPENPAPPAPGVFDVLVADFTSWELMQVDGQTGDRRIHSSTLRGSGAQLASPEGLGRAPNGDILAANLADGNLLEIDPGTGNRTVLSGCLDFPCAQRAGSGPDFLGPRFLALEGSGDVVVSDREVPGIAAVVRVAPGSGNRSIVSGCDDAVCATETGTGPSFDTPFGIAVEAGGQIVVADSYALLAVDPASGDRTVRSGCNDLACTGTTGSGELIRQPRALAIDGSGDFLVVDGDATAPAVFHVDAASGARSVVSGCDDASCSTTTGTGPAFGAGLIGLQIDVAGNLLVTDDTQAALFHVDRSTGERTLLSGCTDAGCSSVAGTGTHFTGPVGIVALPEPDARLALAAAAALLAGLRRLRRS